MGKIDVRKVSERELELFRKQVISLQIKGKNSEVVELLCLPVETKPLVVVVFTRRKTDAFGAETRLQNLGKATSEHLVRETVSDDMIVDHYPDQLKVPFALLDRQAFRQLIKLQFGLAMPSRTVGEYLSCWGYTHQKPIRNAYEQRPAEVVRCMEESYPAIAAQAKAEKADIYWGGEAGISKNGNRARGYAPAEKTPELRLHARKEQICMMSVISNRGKLRFLHS